MTLQVCGNFCKLVFLFYFIAAFNLVYFTRVDGISQLFFSLL